MAPGFLIKFIPFEGCAVLIIAGGDSIPDLIDFNPRRGGEVRY